MLAACFAIARGDTLVSFQCAGMAPYLMSLAPLFSVVLKSSLERFSAQIAKFVNSHFRVDLGINFFDKLKFFTFL